MNVPAAVGVATVLAAVACSPSAEPISACVPVAPAAYTLRLSVGDMDLPGRLDLLCLDGSSPWGRLLVVAGGDSLTGAVRLARQEADSATFASGGAIVGLTLVRGGADSVRGEVQLAGQRAFPFVGSLDPNGPEEALIEHAQLIAIRPGIVSTDSGESYPVSLADGGLIFTRHGADLRRQRLMQAPANQPARALRETPDGVTDRSPTLSPDGRLLLYASNRDPANPDAAREHTTLWYMRQASTGWSDPRPVVWEEDDLPASPQQPALASDGTLYFVDDREDGLGGRDVYRARWDDGAVLQVVRVPPPVSSPEDEAGVYIAPDGRTMVVARTGGPGHQGGDDIYVHVWSGDSWSAPLNLGLPVNTFANEYAPWLNADGTRLWFASDRFGSGDVFSVALNRGPDGQVTVQAP